MGATTQEELEAAVASTVAAQTADPWDNSPSWPSPLLTGPQPQGAFRGSLTDSVAVVFNTLIDDTATPPENFIVVMHNHATPSVLATQQSNSLVINNSTVKVNCSDLIHPTPGTPRIRYSGGAEPALVSLLNGQRVAPFDLPVNE